MASARKRRKGRRRARKLGECVRQFLTPAVWKQAQKVLVRPWQASRWRIQPLVMTLILMSFACGDSREERFEAARAVVIALCPKRRRPGSTIEGLEKAVSRLPMGLLRALAAAVRTRLPEVLGRRWHTGGFVVFGCDGSRLECPRSAALEKRLGQAGKSDSAPTVWLTAIVHLATGVIWSWRLGKGTASEREHLTHLVATLPPQALIVCDAGYTGYALCAALLAQGVCFLIRVSSQVPLYTESDQPVSAFEDGKVYYWTGEARREGLPALSVRLIRVQGESGDVWLLTNVLSPQRLSVQQAGQYYRWRWENEGFFRSYKRTLAMLKLSGRMVAAVHREAEGSLLAAQLLLAMTAQALPATSDPSAAKASPRRALREIRREFQRLIGTRRLPPLARRLAEAAREQRPNRRSPKASRAWPRRKPHKPPGAPQLLSLSILKTHEKPRLEKAA